jgi:hypothetical protein
MYVDFMCKRRLKIYNLKLTSFEFVLVERHIFFVIFLQETLFFQNARHTSNKCTNGVFFFC